MNVSDVLKTAIAMEEEGHAFYMKAKGCTTDAMGQTMYASLAEDELRHKRILEGLLHKADKSPVCIEVPMPKEKLKSVFAPYRDNVCARVTVSADDIAALTTAMEKETESYKMYKGAADDSPAPEAKAIFNRLAAEENQHYEILEQTRYYLEQNQIWSIWLEGGPIEGG